MKRRKKRLLYICILAIGLVIIGFVLVNSRKELKMTMGVYGGKKSADYDMPHKSKDNSIDSPGAGMEMASTKLMVDEDRTAVVKATVSSPTNETGKPDREEQDKPERKRIYRGSLDIGVYDIELKMTEAKHIALASGGFVQEENTEYIVLRVPVAKFRQVFDEIQKLGRVTDKNVSVIDVTELYTDIELRLSIKRKYLEMLRLYLKKVTKVREKIRVMMLIAQVSEEINIMEAQLRYLAEQVSYSTITVSFALEQDSQRSELARYVPPASWVDDSNINELLND